jgi:hypothetical protein
VTKYGYSWQKLLRWDGSTIAASRSAAQPARENDLSTCEALTNAPVGCQSRAGHPMGLFQNPLYKNWMPLEQACHSGAGV